MRFLRTSGWLASNEGGVDKMLFAVTLFVSAALLFSIQPMFTKMVLPLLGGAPAVWNSCLVFFQAALLAGYLYTHWTMKLLRARTQVLLHLILMFAPWLVLPVYVAPGWTPPTDVFPVFWLWALLVSTVGLPFVVVSASAPMLQAWFARTQGLAAKDPYFLYSASNLGSLLALVSYPLFIETNLTLTHQRAVWAIGYGGLMLLVAGCAFRLWRSPPASEVHQKAQPGARPAPSVRIDWSRRWRWTVLALVPSSLLMGVTAHISTDIAAIPLLWILPLSLFLLTFVFVFARRTILPMTWMVRLQPLLLAAAVVTLLWPGENMLSSALIGLVHLSAFFVTAMICHGQLAADRPESEHLTEFYLWLSVGGVLGGMLNALLAPLLFSSLLEYPLMLAAACLLRPWTAVPDSRVRLLRQAAIPTALLLVASALVWSTRSEPIRASWRFASMPAVELFLVLLVATAVWFLRRQPWTLALGISMLAVVTMGDREAGQRELAQVRSFFGVSRVKADTPQNVHILLHGTTTHGIQSLDPQHRRDPWAYFHRKGPLGEVFRYKRLVGFFGEVGVLGLGTGAIAAYGEPDQLFTFYEIDPLVISIARNPDYFTYLADCTAAVDVIPGDGRLSLQNGPSRQFDLLIMDAFSSDSPPLHLITREALQIYLERLKPGGWLVVHISNRYLNLAEPLGNLARELGLVAKMSEASTDAGARGLWAGLFVVIARNTEDLGSLADDARWTALPTSNAPVWTDDFSNLVSAMRWQVLSNNPRATKWWRSSEPLAITDTADRLASEGKIDEAVHHYEKAIRLDPDCLIAHMRLANTLVSQGEVSQAIGHYREVLRIDPLDSHAQNSLGSALALEGKVDEAIGHYRESLKADPDNVFALSNLGYLLNGQGSSDEALQHLQRALKISPDHAEAHNSLGILLAQSGQLDGAIDHIQKALRFKKDYAEAYNNLGILLSERGELDEAIRSYEEALRCKPDFPLARDNLAAALAERERKAAEGKRAKDNPFAWPGN